MKKIQWAFDKFPRDFYSHQDVCNFKEADLRFFEVYRNQLCFGYHEIDPEVEKANRRKSLFSQTGHDPRMFSNKKQVNSVEKDLPINKLRDMRVGPGWTLSKSKFETNVLGTTFVNENNAGVQNHNRQEASYQSKSLRDLSIQNKQNYEKYERQLSKDQSGSGTLINSTMGRNKAVVSDQHVLKNGKGNSEVEISGVLNQLSFIKEELIEAIFKPEIICEILLAKKTKLQEFTNQNYEKLELFLFNSEKKLAILQQKLLVDLNVMNEIYDIFSRLFENPQKGKTNYKIFANEINASMKKYHKRDYLTDLSFQIIHERITDSQKTAFNGTLKKTQIEEKLESFFERKSSKKQTPQKPINRINSLRKSNGFDSGFQKNEESSLKNKNLQADLESAASSLQKKPKRSTFKFNDFLNENNEFAEKGVKNKTTKVSFLLNNMKETLNRNSKRSSLSAQSGDQQQNMRISFDHQKKIKTVFNITQGDVDDSKKNTSVKKVSKPFSEFYLNKVKINEKEQDSNDFYHLRCLSQVDFGNNRNSPNFSYNKILNESRTKFRNLVSRKTSLEQTNKEEK